MLKKLAELFGKRQRSAEPTVRFHVRKGMDLERWRNSPDLIKEARLLWSNPIFLDMMSVLHNSIPSGTMRMTPINPTEAAQDLGRVQGYMECLTYLRMLSEFPDEQPKEIEPDFGADRILADDNYPTQ